MPGFLVHQGATVVCAHAGVATPTVPSPVLTVAGMPVILVTAPWVIAGCSLAAIPAPACVTGTFITASTTVTSFGQPVVLSSSTSTCQLTSTPMIVVSTQTAASAT